MKKNFIKLITFALIASSASVLSSCNDSDEDRMNKLQSELNLSEKTASEAIAQLTEKLKAAEQTLQQRIDNAVCHCTPVDLSGLQSKINAIDAALEPLKNKETVSPAELNATINGALSGYSSVNNAISDALATVKPGHSSEEIVALVKQAVTKQYIIDLIGEHSKGLTEEEVMKMINSAIVINDCSGKINLIDTKIELAEQAIAEKGNSIADLYEKYSSLYGLYITLSGKVLANEVAIGNINNNINSINGSISGINGNISDMKGDIGSINYDINSINNNINGINGNVSDMKGDIKLIKGSLSDIEADVLKNELDINAIDLRIGLLESLSQTMPEKITKDMQQELDKKVKEVKEQAVSNLNEAKAYAERLAEEINANLEKYDFNPTEELETLENKVSDLTGDVKSLNEWKTKIQSQAGKSTQDITNINGEITKIWGEIQSIQNYLKSQITSIQIQSSKNPVFGSLNTPFGIKSSALMGFYGHLDVDPAAVAGTPFANIQSGDVQSSDAGTLYLTINPVTNKFTGVNLNLVNSKGQEAGIVLSAVVPSEEELKFGYTRAIVSENSSNGFYEATAMISDLDKAKMNINRKALRDAALDLYNNRLDANFTNFTKVVLDQVNGVLPAYGVQATWTGEDGATHKVISNYEIAAAAIKPLGYNSLQDFSTGEVPALNDARKFINDLAGAIIKTLGTDPDEVDLAEIIDAFIISPDKNQQTIEVRNKNGVLLGYLQTSNLLNYLYPNLDPSDPWTDAQEKLEQLKTLIANNETAKSDIENIRDRVISYIDKINNRYGKFFDFHHMLQPCMIVETSSVASDLVGTELVPQEVEAGKATVYLTSYNMDILAPAYKKALVVEDPNGTSHQSDLLNCNQSAVEVDFTTPGKYKLTYYAMDFYGKVVKTVSYVKVN